MPARRTKPIGAEQLAEVLSEFARTMVTDFPIQRILDHLVKRIVDILPVSGAGVTLISVGLQPHYVAASDRSILKFEVLQTELGEGPCLAAYHSGTPLSAPDLARESRYPRFSPRALDGGVAAVFTFPLHHGDLQLGALDLYCDRPGPLSRSVTRMAQTLADVAAAYLINAQARSDLEDASEQSRSASLHDALTGLPNRVLILERLRDAFRRGALSGLVTAVFFLDLDDFKVVNDTYGHQVGDELLVAVSRRLTSVLRPGDSLARLSGDEFVVVCEDLESASEADAIAVRFDCALAQPFMMPGAELRINASIGIAFSDAGSDAPEELIRAADLAMYRTKRTRDRGREVLDVRALHLAVNQVSLARGLPRALRRNELHLAYQPIVDSLDGRLTTAEALLRWTHQTRGPVSPAVFIPFAEQSGQIIDLGQWVLEQACSDRREWQREQAADIAIAVNVSPHQFMAVGFADMVARALEQTETDPALLTLEVTEAVFVREDERTLLVLQRLKAIGVKLALDDFGTGYSSLGYLNTLPIDTLKIDQTFIARLGDQPGSGAVVTAIIQLAHGLGMDVVSEGVETAAQHQELTRLGSDSCQGFYFARPMSGASLAALLADAGDRSPLLPASVTAASQPRTGRA